MLFIRIYAFTPFIYNGTTKDPYQQPKSKNFLPALRDLHCRLNEIFIEATLYIRQVVVVQPKFKHLLKKK